MLHGNRENGGQRIEDVLHVAANLAGLEEHLTGAVVIVEANLYEDLLVLDVDRLTLSPPAAWEFFTEWEAIVDHLGNGIRLTELTEDCDESRFIHIEPLHMYRRCNQ